MKRVLIFAAAAAAALAAVGAAECGAAENERSQVPKTVLSDLGLGGMQPISDSQGLQVRGKAVLFGSPGSDAFITGPKNKPLGTAVVVGHMSGQTFIVNHPHFNFKVVP